MSEQLAAQGEAASDSHEKKGKNLGRGISRPFRSESKAAAGTRACRDGNFSRGLREQSRALVSSRKLETRAAALCAVTRPVTSARPVKETIEVGPEARRWRGPGAAPWQNI